ncbi:hypothetical protein [Aurantimonas sp. HBX-1]|uniref:hypothetical protein n=1 Tax=Aurantimonas sp. HBX-1 TaxID=2906072 RepID=UPI001F3839E5|nr:hypothetical protein [Aurantimonas sp. HBX-1]UIJ73349.1 hypothetical protein LXB15_06830 [Aurantimonas sp. HBX-1]
MDYILADYDIPASKRAAVAAALRERGALCNPVASLERARAGRPLGAVPFRTTTNMTTPDPYDLLDGLDPEHLRPVVVGLATRAATMEIALDERIHTARSSRRRMRISGVKKSTPHPAARFLHVPLDQTMNKH